jgi:hypothetical protein
MKKRCVIEMSDELAAKLKKKADQLEMPVSGTVKLAIATLLKLSDEIADGGTVVVEKKNGGKVALFAPQLGQ